MSRTFNFRWPSLLGIAVILFLLWGAFNFYLAIFVPLSLHRNGAGVGALGSGGLVLGREADAALVGRPLTELAQADPKLDAYLVAFMDTMCAQMMAYAIVHLAIVWFALRRGQAWALWAAAAGGLVSFVYIVPVVQLYARFAVPLEGFVEESLIPMAIVVVVILLATALGWLGLRPGQRSMTA